MYTKASYEFIIFWNALSLFTTFVNAENPIQCGGTLTATRGVLQTPGFPNEFQVPILCKWVIDATEISSPNTSIVVYLTQLFVSEGLTFEEYETYDMSYNILGKRIHTVLENNVSKVKLISTNQNVLVVTFELTSIENTHLRILDYFLDVYGFNITYEIITEPIRHDSCIMSDCGFTGTCYYDYTKFYCRCFMGYSGPTCSNGPNSLCSSDGTSFCQNDGICRLVGTTLASCNCAEGFTGERCETKIDLSAKNNCVSNEWDRNCNNCSSTKTDAELSTRLRLMQGPSLKKESLKEIIRNQISLFKINVEQIVINDLNYYEWGTEAVVNFYGIKRDKKRLETLLNRWKQSGSIGSLTLVDKNTYNESRLSIKSVSINQSGLIREADRFVLSCVAQGSPRMTFKWYKDGIVINVTKFTNNKWLRLIPDTHARNQYTSLLGVDEASILDEGTFVCEVEDHGIRQCLTKVVEIRQPPSVKIEPLTLTVQKGENFTIKCISLSKADSNKKYTYSWTKNKGLLPIKTEMEKYEILFPGGSILQVSRIERPTMYSCLVQDEVTSSEVSIQVDVIDRTLVRTCRGEKHMNILWPETAPGTQSVQECPKGFIGVVTRWCILHDPEKSIWQLPDFSFCTANSLHKSEINFQRLQLGYMESNELEYLNFYYDYLKNKISNLLPGEGARILTMTNDIINYINQTRSNNVIPNATTVVFNIADAILKHNNSLINQMQVILLQQVISSQIGWSREILDKLQTYHRSYKRIDVSFAKLDQLKMESHIPFDKQMYPPWFSYKLNVMLNNPQEPHEMMKSNKSVIVSCVVYQNLELYLPSRSVIRLQDGTEMEYEIISKIAAVWLSKHDISGDDDRFLFVMEFSHPTINTTTNQWNINCSFANYANYGYMWNVNTCQTELINATRTKCICSKPGSYAVFVTTVPVTMAKEEIYSYQQLVLIGCCVCFVFSFISTIILTMYWCVKKSSITFLKIQYCVAISSAMMIFIIALSRELTSESYAYINTFLEISLLVSMASHISKCLMVFTEFAQHSKAPNLNKTIVAISTGVPIITVFASHLTYRTMGKRQSSWWLINGSVSFNIFISAALVKIFLYNIMYLMVMDKITEAINDQNKSSSLALKRKKLLRRSFSIFWSTVMMISSSVMYINMRESQIWNYTFAISNIILVLIFFTSYIYHPETSFAQDLIEIVTLRSNKKCTTGTSPRSPSNESPESNLDKQSTLRRKSTDDQSVTNSKPSVQLSDLQNIPNCAQNYSPEAYNDENVYNTSNKEPVRNRHIGKFQSFKECLRQQEESSYSCNQQQTYLYSPDVVATRVHVELDLVTPIMHDANCDHKHLTPDETPIILCNIAVNSRCNGKQYPLHPTVADQKSVTENFENVQKVSTTKPSTEKVQPKAPEAETKTEENGKENIENVVKPTSSDSLDGMLDKISHDLDYLLNRRKSNSSLSKIEGESCAEEEKSEVLESHAF